LFPAEKRDRLDKTLRRAEIRMGKWLIGQGSLMLILDLQAQLFIYFCMFAMRMRWVLTGY